MEVSQQLGCCKCHYCCFIILPHMNKNNNNNNYPNSLDHQTSTNITNNSSTFQYDFATATISSLYPNTLFTNPESLPTLHQSFRRFTSSFPQYLNTVEVDQIRSLDFPHLSNPSNNITLDYFGHALFSYTQQGEENNNISMKASSSSSSSSATAAASRAHGEVVEKCLDQSKLKRRIMRYLNVQEEDYSMYYTTSQTSAFRVVGESYPFKTNNKLVTVYDHENEGVEAMIESSKSRGGRVFKAEFKWPKLKIHCKKLEDIVVGNGNNNGSNVMKSKKKKKKESYKGLFVFPIQSRVSGARYSYQWMSMARENGWHVLLDATSLGPKDMDTLGLSLFQPDFLICTFYKVFGHDPSGFACLLVKKSNPLVLNQSDFWASRGIVTLVDDQEKTKTSGTNMGECDDNTIECKALDHADALGLALIGTRTRCLVNWVSNALLALNHPRSDKDAQLVQVYGPRVRFDRGPALAFNVFDWKGEKVDPVLVQKLGDRNGISIGCGCLKQVWFSERYEGERRGLIKKGKKGEKVKSEITVVTVSLSYLTNFEDMYRVWEFVAKFLDADFVEKERWRYTALNQKTIHI